MEIGRMEISFLKEYSPLRLIFNNSPIANTIHVSNDDNDVDVAYTAEQFDMLDDNFRRQAGEQTRAELEAENISLKAEIERLQGEMEIKDSVIEDLNERFRF